MRTDGSVKTAPNWVLVNHVCRSRRQIALCWSAIHCTDLRSTNVFLFRLEETPLHVFTRKMYSQAAAPTALEHLNDKATVCIDLGGRDEYQVVFESSNLPHPCHRSTSACQEATSKKSLFKLLNEFMGAFAPKLQHLCLVTANCTLDEVASDSVMQGLRSLELVSPQTDVNSPITCYYPVASTTLGETCGRGRQGLGLTRCRRGGRRFEPLRDLNALRVPSHIVGMLHTISPQEPLTLDLALFLDLHASAGPGRPLLRRSSANMASTTIYEL
jgi:hypothetical protein